MNVESGLPSCGGASEISNNNLTNGYNMPELKTFVALLFFAPYLSARLDFPSPHYLSLGLEYATVLD